MIPESGGGRIVTVASKLSVLPSTLIGEVGRRIFFTRNASILDSEPCTITVTFVGISTEALPCTGTPSSFGVAMRPVIDHFTMAS